MTEYPIIRKGQRWLFQGQDWKVHELLDDGVVVLIGPYQHRDLHGVTAEELYAAGELKAEAPTVVSRKADRMVAQFEKARAAAGRPRRPKKPKPPSEYQPWRVSILAVDAAANSGWSLWVDGALIAHGEVRKDNSVELLNLCKRAHDQDRPTVLVRETIAGFVYPGHGAMVIEGLGAARQAWQHAWLSVGGYKTRDVPVKPPTWRGGVFGGGLRGVLGRGKRVADFERQWAEIQVRKYFTRSANDNGVLELGSDECTAVCIGFWGTRAGEVGYALPLKLRVHAA